MVGECCHDLVNNWTICLSVCLSVCLFVRTSVRPSVCLCVRPSVLVLSRIFPFCIPVFVYPRLIPHWILSLRVCACVYTRSRALVRLSVSLCALTFSVYAYAYMLVRLYLPLSIHLSVFTSVCVCVCVCVKNLFNVIKKTSRYCILSLLTCRILMASNDDMYTEVWWLGKYNGCLRHRSVVHDLSTVCIPYVCTCCSLLTL